MEHADTAQLAAVGGALGAVLVLVARGRGARFALIVGLLALAVSEVTLAFALGGGILDRLSGATGVAALLLGIAGVIAAAAAFVRWPGGVPLAGLVTPPLPAPPSVDNSGTLPGGRAPGGRARRAL